MKIAAAQYKIEIHRNWLLYIKKIEQYIIQAKKRGAELLLLPEYAGIEAACGFYSSDAALFAAIQANLPNYIELFRNLASKHQLYIQPGTIVVQATATHYVNRAYFFSPEGNYGYQDKLQLIAYEKSSGSLQQGNQQRIFKTALGVIGIAICYDCEFPELVNRLVQSGADYILVPSYTTSLAGFHRVYYSCRARALENQCFVIMSSVVGECSNAGETEVLTGQANILGPIDERFSNDGLILQGPVNEEKLIVASLESEKLWMLRKCGQVHNYYDAAYCSVLLQHPVTCLTL